MPGNIAQLRAKLHTGKNVVSAKLMYRNPGYFED